MTCTRTTCILLIGTQIGYAFGAMYLAYTIKPEGFVVDNTSNVFTDSGEMTAFMCHINADKNGHGAFRISNDTGKCEIGNINTDAVQSSDGIRVYVRHSITVQKCLISPTIAYEKTFANR